MAVANYWLENILSLPVLAYRDRRVFPILTDEELEAYLALTLFGMTGVAALLAALKTLADLGVAAPARRVLHPPARES